MTAKQLISFEKKIEKLYMAGKIRVPIHFSGGNEKQLIDIFKNVNKNDYVFSTHRNHYHAILHGVPGKEIINNILHNDMGSMHTICPKRKFYSSAIVGGIVNIACGTAYALKLKKSKIKVWAFIGDAATDQGWFSEALRYSISQDLPITFVIENNDRSVCTTNSQRWGNFDKMKVKHIKYQYAPTYPHVGNGKMVRFM